MTSTLDKLSQIGVLPIITLDDPETAVPVAEALIAGGIHCGEVTFRTPAAAESIARISKAFPDFELGAGTIISIDQAKAALDAGARYLIAPGFSNDLARFCQEKETLFFPGVMTPTDVTNGIVAGLSVLKFFPAGAAGGIKLLKAFAGPFHQIKFAPTGGINAENLADYLSLPNVSFCGGS